LTEKIDAELMDKGKDLVVVSTMSVGYEHIDVKEATKRGIYICNTPGVLTEAVADHTFTLILGVARRLTESDRFIREKKWIMPWSPTMFLGVSVHNKTLGIIGLGRIGRAVAKRARGFNMNLIYYDVFRNQKAEEELNINYKNLADVLKTADYVFVHVPLTEETYHLFGEREFRLMKSTAIFVNTLERELTYGRQSLPI
jgi:glyoxylate reductase